MNGEPSCDLYDLKPADANSADTEREFWPGNPAADELDFRLDNFEPSDAASARAEQASWPGDLTVLAQHQTTPNGSHTFVAAHDRSITWDVPGEPQVAAIMVARDLSLNTFTFESSHHITLAFVQNWLVERGCPPEQITQAGGDSMKPADDLTVRTEQHIRESGTRYEVLDSHNSDFDPCETWTLTRDSSTDQAPIRVFLEEGTPTPTRTRCARAPSPTRPPPATGLRTGAARCRSHPNTPTRQSPPEQASPSPGQPVPRRTRRPASIPIRCP